jgi:hypothetical protein
MRLTNSCRQIDREMSSSARTMLPSLDAKVCVTFDRVMTGKDEPTLPEANRDGVADSAVAPGSTGIKSVRFFSCNRDGTRHHRDHLRKRRPQAATQFSPSVIQKF